jgi:hypothetical protein
MTWARLIQLYIVSGVVAEVLGVGTDILAMTEWDVR